MIATAVPIARAARPRALEAGKHCFVEKPLAVIGRARPTRWSAAADARRRVLMVDHLLEYHPGVAKLKEIVDRASSARSSTSTATG